MNALVDHLPICLLLGVFAVLMILRVPITFCLLFATLASACANGTRLSVLVRQLLDGVNNFSLLAIPFFILMGEFMGAGGISDKIIDSRTSLSGVSGEGWPMSMSSPPCCSAAFPDPPSPTFPPWGRL